MIIIFHSNNRVTEVEHDDRAISTHFKGADVVEAFQKLAYQFPESILVWCREECKAQLNRNIISHLFNHQRFLYSYNLSEIPFLSDRIGYLEDTPFFKINRNLRYPTWLMSGDVGAVHAAVINACAPELFVKDTLDYFLNSLAKMAMPRGLLCYSEPKLLHSIVMPNSIRTSEISTLFKFAGQHYKKRWLLFLVLNLWIYERKLPVAAFFSAFFYKSRKLSETAIAVLHRPKTDSTPTLPAYDVVIPTIGREKYLYDVLRDLNVQSHFPKNVIIVEQNPEANSQSTLDFITKEPWNFQIKHTFTHQVGACNARNLALGQVVSEMVFFADDDIRIDPSFVANALTAMESYKSSAVTVNCLLQGQVSLFKEVMQWPYFGSGCSFVALHALKGKHFKMGYEFGFGEDTDFGMQLRNSGCDIIFLPNQKLLHLKAPVGGFRVKPILPWQGEGILPKPSPTIMLYLISHLTKTQLRGYKTVLLFKFFKHQSIRNPFKYYKNFNLRWERSQFWANELMKR